MPKQVAGFVALFWYQFFAGKLSKALVPSCQIFVFHSQHQINLAVGLFFDLARTSVLEISKEDRERRISKDRSGDSSTRPGHGMQRWGDQ